MSSGRRICLIGNVQSIHVQRWARGLASRGWQVTVYGPFHSADPDFQSVSWTSRSGGRFTGLLALPSQVAEQREFFRTADFDLLWVHAIDQGPRLALLPKRVPLAVTVYGSDVIPAQGSAEDAPSAPAASRLLRRAAVITAASDFLADFARTRFSLRRAIDVVPFGVDTELFAPRADDCEDGEAPTLVYSKGMKAIYGLDVLLEALAILTQNGRPCRLIVAGAGDDRLYRETARNLGVADNVDFIGQVDQAALSGLLAKASVFVMPTVVRESFGVAAVEAMSSGVPVVASRIGAIPDVVSDGQTGLLVEPGDHEDLAAAIRRLIDDKELRQRFAAAGRQVVLARFQWDATLDAMNGLLLSAAVSSTARNGVAR